MEDILKPLTQIEQEIKQINNILINNIRCLHTLYF